MTAVLPVPVALPDPPGSPAELDAVLHGLSAAGFSAGLAVHLLEPAAALDGWQGADARVAAGEVAAATRLTAALRNALAAGLDRLVPHAELWLRVAGRVAELREEQRADFHAARARLAVLLAPTAAAVPAPDGATALVADAVAADADRRTEHAALLAALEEDGGATAAALARATAALDGGDPGTAAALTVRLAARLPGWGHGELTRLAVEAAADLTRPGTSHELLAAAHGWLPFATDPVFAGVLVGRLGADGLRWTLSVLGQLAGTGAGAPLATLLATAVTAAGAGGAPAGRAAEALAGLRLDPADPDGAVDQVAVGMGVVLAVPTAGAELAATWGRQVLEREDAQGAGAVDRTTGTRPDPVAAALTVLARAGDPAAAAGLLASAPAWRALLERSWPAGGADLARVIGLATDAAGAPAVATGLLQALGRGLDPDPGDRDDPVFRDVDRATLRLLAAPLGDLVAGQVDGLVPALGAAGAGTPVDAASEAALRGLGLLVSEPAAGGSVTAALAAALPAAGSDRGGQVAGAYVAVEEFGDRIGYALEYARALSDATDWHLLWTLVTAPRHLVRGPVEELVDGLLDAAATGLHADGEAHLPPDTGRVRTAEDAVCFLRQARHPGGTTGGAEEAARAAFAAASALLTRPVPPVPDPLDVIDETEPPPERRRRPIGWRTR